MLSFFLESVQKTPDYIARSAEDLGYHTDEDCSYFIVFTSIRGSRIMASPSCFISLILRRLHKLINTRKKTIERAIHARSSVADKITFSCSLHDWRVKVRRHAPISPAGTPSGEKMVIFAGRQNRRECACTFSPISPAGENVQPITDRSQVQPRPLTLFG